MKKLVSFSRPKLTGNETDEEKEKIIQEYSEELAEQILYEMGKCEKENETKIKPKEDVLCLKKRNPTKLQ